MRVAVKFVFALVLVLLLIRTSEGYLTVRRETARLDAAIRRDAELLGQMLKVSVRRTWAANGRDRALGLIDVMNVSGHPMRFSWARFDGARGLRSRLDAETLTKLKSGETVAMRQRHDEKGDIQYFFVPIDIAESDGAIQLTETLEDRSRYIRHALVRELAAGGVVALASGAAVILLGIFVIGRPLSRLRTRIHRIGEGDLSARLVLRGHDELSTLAEGLNEMCERLSASREREHAETEKRLAAMDQVRHMDRLTTIGRLASGIAHELGTPLSVIGGRAEMIRDGTISAETDEIQRNAGTIKSQADRMTQIIQHLLDFARQRPPQRIKADGVEVVRQVIELVTCLGYEGTVHLETAGDRGSHVAEMDPVQIQQVMTNLIENALQAMPEGGEAIVGVKSVTASAPDGIDVPGGRFLKITVEDHGAGIAEEHLPKVFDPFFTTKDVGEGTGLGLSITYGIVREHGGWIEVSSKVNAGSRFTVFLPQEDV